ncbi:MAG: sensor histidine kinase, partial [Pseudanabaena sp.]
FLLRPFFHTFALLATPFLNGARSELTILSGRARNVQIIKNYINLPKINGYTDRLIQVFMNLLSNAIDALMDLRSQPDLIQKRNQALHKEENEDNRGAVQVQNTSDLAWQPLIMISVAIADLDHRKWVSIKIADNGMGIPDEIQDRIFDNFFATKGQSKGTGLGLAICHQIITQQHNGKIVLRSPYLNHQGNVTIGTEFEVLLPIY